MGHAVNTQNVSFLVGSEREEKITNKRLVRFYESKINCLMEKGISNRIIILTSRDAPIQPGDINSKWQRRTYINKCLRYYRSKIRELERSASWLSLFRIFG